MRRLRLSVAVLGLLLAVPAWAETPGGVWTGKVGRAAIVVCFETDAERYYYVKVGVDIPLVQREPGLWVEKQGEAPATGIWNFPEPEDGVLTGTWKSPDGKRSLPIKLRRPMERIADECVSADYNAARVAAVTRTPGKPETRGWLTTRPFDALDKEVTGLEIVGDSAGPAPLRRAVERLNRDVLRRYFECMAFGAGKNTTLEFSAGITVLGVTDRHVVLRQSVGYWCGGAHPDGDDAFFILERKSGKAVDVESWFKVLPAKIARKHWKSNEERCADTITNDTPFLVWPSADGMVFRPVLPHAVEACGEDVKVPYARLAGMLTPEGKRAAGEFAGAK